ncbi:MAG: helix-turn-helix domain-containing protein [Rhodanobacter sp.]
MSKASIQTSPRLLFARNLRQARRLQELSQEALALQAGLSRTYVSEVERGTRNISIDNMGLLADALGIALCDLLVTDMLKRLAAR